MLALRFALLLSVTTFSLQAAEQSSLRAELESLHEKDQALRIQLNQATPHSDEWKKLWTEQQKRDRENAAQLETLIAENGWPKISEVGKHAANTAFLIVQHSDLGYQKKCLPLLREAVDADEALPNWLALLEDRILMFEGKKQIYGTQLWASEDGILKPWPIENEHEVDTRRARMNLEPIADYLSQFGITYTPDPNSELPSFKIVPSTP